MQEPMTREEALLEYDKACFEAAEQHTEALRAAAVKLQERLSELEKHDAGAPSHRIMVEG